MTEDEAKTKWCPLVRVGGPMQSEAEGTSANRWAGQSISAPQACDYLCIASECMAWRWNGDSPAFAGAGPEDSLDYSSRKGFCGAFGVPVSKVQEPPSQIPQADREAPAK
jgi:hypothetical protein